jgi:HK97 family phage major capsid protein
VAIDPSIIMSAQGSSDPFLELARQVPVTTNVWKGVTSAGVSWSFDSEASEVSDDSPWLSQPSATVFTARGFIPYSLEVADDYPSFAAEMEMLLAEGYSELLADKFARGTGSGEPEGVLTALSANTNVRVRVTTAGQLGLADLHRVWSSLPERFRSRASWVSEATVLGKIRELGAAVGASFSVTLMDAGPERLMGRPYRTSAYLEAATTSTANVALAILGDFSGFVVARRSGLRIEPVQHLVGANRRPTGQRGMFAWGRVGRVVANPAGFRLLTNAT